jgi:hypothetical protein
MAPMPEDALQKLPALAVALDAALGYATEMQKKSNNGTGISVLGRAQGRQYFIEISGASKKRGRVLGPSALREFAAAYNAVLEYENEDGTLRMRLLV